MNFLSGWKTITYAASIVLAVLMVPEVQTLIASYPTAATIINGGIIVALRFVTTSGVFGGTK